MSKSSTIPKIDRPSFWSLDVAEQKTVRHLFDKKYKSGAHLDLDHGQVFRHQKALSTSLAYFSLRIDKINPASFKYMDPNQTEVLEQELLFAFYIFSAQYQLDEAEHRRQGLRERSEQIKRCAQLINELRKSTHAVTCETLLASATDDDSEKHAKYLGLTLVAPYVAEKMVDIASGTPQKIKEWEGAGKTRVIKETMGEVNGRRLYWVWGGNLLNTVISLLPEEFSNKKQAQDVVTAPAPVTGYMSWILYYARFGINLSLLLKHTIAGPWMSKKERQIPTWDRFKTQWDQRKFSLLNDSIWATANLACFYWLVGSGTLGYLGNVVTAGLLLMDVCLTVWRFYEESTQHNRNMARYTREIEDLQRRIELKKVADEEEKLWLLQLNELEKAKKQSESDWRYKKYSTVTDLVYATGLMVAFTLMCGFLFPPAMLVPATAVALSVAGAALCFVLTTAYSAVNGGLDIAKSKATRESAKKEYKELLKQFLAVDDKREDEPEEKRRYLYLEMKQLMAQSDYQDRLIKFQAMKLTRSILIDAMIPPLMFVSLIFMPLGIGLAVLAAGLVLSVLTHVILKRFEPQPDKLPEFNESDYLAFAESVEPKDEDRLEETPEPRYRSSLFFSGSSNKSQSSTELDDDESLSESLT